MPGGTMRSSYRARARPSSNFRKKVQKIISKNLEKKFVVNIANLVAIGDNNTVQYELNDPSQGDGQNNRNGNQIKVTGFYGKWIIQPNSGTLVTPTNLYQPLVRVVMYIPKDPDDNNPVTAIGSEIDTDLYNVMYDEIRKINVSETTKFTFKKSFTRGGKVGMNTQFTGAAGTTVSKNPIRLLFYSNQTLATEEPLLTGHMKCWFTDA